MEKLIASTLVFGGLLAILSVLLIKVFESFGKISFVYGVAVAFVISLVIAILIKKKL